MKKFTIFLCLISISIILVGCNNPFTKTKQTVFDTKENEQTKTVKKSNNPVKNTKDNNEKFIVDTKADIKEAVYPEDYYLLENEVPAGFALKILDEDAKKANIEGNPGSIINSPLAGVLLKGIDIKKIEKLYVSIFNNMELESKEIWVLAARYILQDDLDNDAQKLLGTSSDCILLTGNLILVKVQSDNGAYPDEIRAIADSLIARLNLIEVK